MREYMRGLYLHSREYRKIFLRSHFLHISQILEGNYFGAYTCRACIRTHANTGKYSWGIIYVLVSCQGVLSCHFVARDGICFLLFYEEGRDRRALSTNLGDSNLLLKGRLDFSSPFFLSENRIWGQWAQMLQML